VMLPKQMGEALGWRHECAGGCQWFTLSSLHSDDVRAGQLLIPPENLRRKKSARSTPAALRRIPRCPNSPVASERLLPGRWCFGASMFRALSLDSAQGSAQGA